MNRTLALTAYLLGLLAVGWVGAGYIGHSPLALTMTALIGVVYLAGGLELLRFQQATASLARALEAIPEGLASLGDWLGQVHPSLHNPVRLRIEGERSGLPGPAVTPYLVGLLVLLGMLGTFLGMVVTLNGAVLALESTTDLHTIRAALAAPVKGLGVAFGTSVAGVAASAMLGLVSTLCRRQRLLVGQRLDARIAGELRSLSLGHQRQEAFKAIQAQAQALPEVVTTLQTMMAQLERHNQQLADRLLAGQESHYREAKGVYTALAASVDQSLRDSLSHSARLAGEAIQPVVEATMAGIARETSSLRETLTDTVAAQLDGLAGRFDSTVTTVADTWTNALARHEQTSNALQTGLDATLGRFTDSFEARSAGLLASVEQTHASLQATTAQALADINAETRGLHAGLASKVEAQLDGLASRFGSTVTTVADTWTSALARHEASSNALQTGLDATLGRFTDTFEARSANLLASVEQTHASLQATTAQALADIHAETRGLHAGLASKVEAQLDGLAGRFDNTVTTVADTWTTALARHEQTSNALQTGLDATLGRFTDTFEARSANLLASVEQTHASLQATTAQALADIHAETRGLHAGLASKVEAQLDGLAGRFDSTVTTVADTWTNALARHEQTSNALQTGLDATLGRFTDTFEARSVGLLASVEQTHASLQATTAQALADIHAETRSLHDGLADKVETQLDALASRFGSTVSTVADTWTAALARHEQTSDALARDTREALAAFVDNFKRSAAEQLDALHGAHAALQSDLATRDAQRLAGMGAALEALAASLQQHWLDAGNAAEARQAEICRTLDETARSLSASTQAEARHTIAEVERLMLTAAEAPRAAAEVIGQLRHELSASIARDNSLLEERSRIMETLASLLDCINHASTEQKSAIDALVTSSASLLERVGSQFEARTESESTRLAEAAAQIAGGAVEVASLGEAFGFAVERFGESNQQLTEALSRIEAALAQSLTRSDEQLAYYVAQAREIIDLSIMSQRQIVDDLQQLPARQAAQPSEA